MDQGTLLNTISEQRNGALNQVAILQAQLATANKEKEALQAQCDALNKKLQEVSRARLSKISLAAPTCVVFRQTIAV